MRISRRQLAMGHFVIWLCLPLVQASRTKQTESFVKGTLLGIERYRVESPSYTAGGSNPSDAPLAIGYYAYDVSIRVNWNIYVGRYNSPFKYPPFAFPIKQPLRVRVSKYVLSIDLPEEADLSMRIVKTLSDPGCRDAPLGCPQ